jgi:hypothetical protein
MMRLARRASLVVVLLVLMSVGTACAECAWVLWEHVTGVRDGRAHDFWLLREASDTKKQCYERADTLAGVEAGEFPDTLSGKLSEAGRPPGWSVKRTVSGSVERGPDTTRQFSRHDLECWPTGTDPRPR